MRDLIKWVVIIALLVFGYFAGWFNPIINYFQKSAEYARQEQVINESDGSVTTVRYRSFVDIITGR